MSDAKVITSSKTQTPALALASAFVLLPWLLMVPVLDTDRFVPLLFLPALLLSWRSPSAGSNRVAILFAWLVAAMLVAAVFSEHTSRSLVMSAAIGCTLAGACVARRCSLSEASIRLILQGLLVGAATGGVMVWLGWGAGSMFFPVYWSARLFGGHMLSGALAGIALLLLAPRDRRTLFVHATLTLLCWTGLAWSGSRAPAVALAMTLALWFWRGGSAIRRPLLKWSATLGILALLCSRPLGTPYPQLGWWSAVARTSQASSVAEITSARTDYWSGVWSQVKESPWIGNGADAYLFLKPKQPGNQPHNTYLQWLLEYGILGALPWIFLGTLTLAPLKRRPSMEDASAHRFQLWAAACMVGLGVYAFFDGVGYHMVIFMPAAVLAGLALGSTHAPGKPTGPTPPSWPVRLVPLAAMSLLLLHGWLNLLLMRGQNIAPDSWPARILWHFPSTTYGLTRWTEAWRKTDPETAIRWIEWAQKESTNPGSFHVHAAQIYIWQKNWSAAERELQKCLAKVSSDERPDVQVAIDNVRKYSAEQSKASVPSGPSSR